MKAREARKFMSEKSRSLGVREVQKSRKSGKLVSPGIRKSRQPGSPGSHAGELGGILKNYERIGIPRI